jgi:hypothetical protein
LRVLNEVEQKGGPESNGLNEDARDAKLTSPDQDGRPEKEHGRHGFASSHTPGRLEGSGYGKKDKPQGEEEAESEQGHGLVLEENIGTLVSSSNVVKKLAHPFSVIEKRSTRQS